MSFPLLRRYAPLVVALLLAGGRLAAQTPVKTFVVNSTNDRTDVSPGDGKCATGFYTTGTTPECTLRAAVDESRSGSASAYVISVPAGTYNMTATEPTCYYYDQPYSKVSLCPGNNVTIKGAGAGSTILDFGGQSRGFIIPQANTVSIGGLTIQNGTPNNDNPYGGGGGGIINLGTLTLGQCMLFNNVSGNNGGAAVYTTGTLNVAACSFQNNGQEAIRVVSGTTGIDSSTFTSTLSGTGAVYGQGGSISISNSTFTLNQTSHVLYLTGPTTVTNTTISGNSTYGNAVDISYSAVSLSNDTITGNTISNGFGLNVGQALGGGNPPVSIANTILTNNQSRYGDCVGPIIDRGHNLLGTLGYQCGPSDPTSQSGVGDPKLSTLEIDGGSVPTMTPLAGSPAIGGGSTATPGGNAAGACTALDENGLPRGVGATCSVGAAEPLKGFQVNRVTPTSGGTGGNITMVVTGSGFDPATTVALRRSGQSDIATQALLASPDATALSAGFSLVGAALGTYDVVVASSTGTITLPGAFTVASPTSNAVQTFLSGPAVLRSGRPGTYVVTYSNTGNTDAYLVPLYLGLSSGLTGGIKGFTTPPANAQQALTDYSASSLAVDPGTQPATVNVPLLLPVVPAGSWNTLTFTVNTNGNEGDSFFVNQLVGIPYSSNPDTGVADTGAISAAVASAVLDDTLNLGVTPSAQAQTAMATYADSQLRAIVAAGQTALLQSYGAAPIVFSISQLLDDVGAYGAAYKPSQAVSRSAHPLYLPSPWHPPVPPNCDETPMPPGSSCNAPFAPFPGHSPYNPCGSNLLLQFVATQNNDCPPKNGPKHPIVGSVDPNLKTGPAGVGAAHYTLANTPFPYLIEFENEASASAPAQSVSVTDSLDTTKLDLSTFQFGPISFGSVPFVLNPPPGVTSFQGSIDLRPVDNIIVDVTAALNKSTGVVTWSFLSLDPATMQLTTDPTAGFLPPDTTPPAGIGHVAFTINPFTSVADAAAICNTATVVFDTNNPIDTAQYCNTKDITPPTSMVQPLAAAQSSTTFAVAWSGSDTGSGVGPYTIYVSDNGGPFAAWLTATQSTSGSYTGTVNHTYGFYSIASDLAGNVEAAKAAAEATTMISGPSGASLNPTSVAFGPVRVGSYASATITVTSNGASALNISGFTLSDTADFAQSNNCGAPLPPGQTCAVIVSFKPGSGASTTAVTTATLTLLSDAGVAPAAVALSGFASAATLLNVWVANGNGTLSELSDNGGRVSPPSGYAGGGAGIAIDNAGHVWSATPGGSSVVEFAKTGSLIGTYTGAGVASPVSLAIDGQSNVWVANGNGTLSVFNSSGVAVSAVPIAAAGNISRPTSLSIDAAGSVWVSSAGNNTVTEVIGVAAPAPVLVNAVTNATPGTKP